MAFCKGQSANPEGRKVEAMVMRAARTEGLRSVAALAALRDNERAAPEVRAQAAMRLLDMTHWNWNGNRRGASAAPVLQRANGGI